MKRVTQSRDVTVQVHFEDGSYWATVDECPGLFAAGDTEHELFESVTDGLRVYLAKDGREPEVELRDVCPPAQSPVSKTVKKTLVTA
jgi:predicted RNase H-like HicB family nuclease